MMRGKRADITFTQIVYAAIALVVLIVLILVFTGQIGILSKIFGKTGGPTEATANKVGWCIDTLTMGKACDYAVNCGEIANRLGGTPDGGPWDAAQPPKTTDCSKPGDIRAYSSSDKKFCCVKV